MTPLPADPAGSAYFLDHEMGTERRATFAVIVDNEPGVLHRGGSACSPRAATTSRA